MACYFFMAVECGPGSEAAEKVADHFQDLHLKLSDGSETQCEAGSSTQPDKEGNFWCWVTPVGVNYAGAKTNHNLTDEPHVTEIALLLYQHLMSAPPFRYALAGWEPGDFAFYSELRAILPEWLQENGIVVSREIYEQSDGSISLEPFGANHLWQPYKGVKAFGR